MSQEKIGQLILRLGLAGVYLWFGVNQLMDGSKWVKVVPEWATSLSGLTAPTIVMMNGILEVVLGILLALGFWMVPVAVILALHLFVIASGFGLTPVGVRDYGLAVATLSLAFLGRR